MKNMKTIEQIRRENLAALTQKYGGVLALSETLERDSSQVSQWLNASIRVNGKPSNISARSARRIEEVLGLKPLWLDQEQNSQEKQDPVTQVKEHSFEIPLLNVSGSMGTGSHQPENEIAISHLQVTRDWIRENLSAVSSPSNISMITGLGDSMEPTYKHGDTLFVDTGITNIDLDAVYVMVLNNELYIKRIQRRPDGIWVISDNKLRYDPYLIKRSDLEQIRVVGRVCGTMNFNRI